MFLFRPHRSTLADSLAEKVELKDFDALVKKTQDDFQGYMDIEYYRITLIINKDTIKIESYCFDERIEWDTYIVTLKNYGVLGFTNQPVPQLEETP